MKKGLVDLIASGGWVSQAWPNHLAPLCTKHHWKRLWLLPVAKALPLNQEESWSVPSCSLLPGEVHVTGTSALHTPQGYPILMPSPPLWKNLASRSFVASSAVDLAYMPQCQSQVSTGCWPERFSHHKLKDPMQWRTAWGSWKKPASPSDCKVPLISWPLFPLSQHAVVQGQCVLLQFSSLQPCAAAAYLGGWICSQDQPSSWRHLSWFSGVATHPRALMTIFWHCCP